MYKSVFFWYFVSSIIRGTYSCEPKTKQEITARITDSLQNYPEYESFTVFGDRCESYFRIESTDTDTNIEIQLKSPANNYFNSKLKRIKTFCSVSAVKKSVLSTSRETKLINKHKALSETHSFDNLRNSLVSLTGYAKETIDTHCSESEKPLLIQTLMNNTLIQLVGTNPWRNTPHDYPYESVKLSNSKKHKYFSYNLWTDILALIVIGVVLLIFIPETTHLFIGSSPVCVPCRLTSKLTQSIRFVTMTAIKYPTNVFTLANFKMAYENITSGFNSVSGKFLHDFSKTEIKNQKIRSRYPYDMQVYEAVTVNQELDENHVLVNPAIQTFTENQRMLAIQTPEYAELSETHLQALGFTNAKNEVVPTREINFDVHGCTSTFKLVRILAAVLIILGFWSIIIGFLATIGLPPIVLYQAVRRIFGWQI